MPRPGVLPQHARLIERAVARFRTEPDVAALVVGGSVAHGLARPDSDVDFILVVDDAALAARPALNFADATLADYDGGYADVKVVSEPFFAEVAARGSEPARWALLGAFPAWSRLEEIEAALAAASAYPEAERETKIHDFAAHTAIAAWFLGEAEKRSDRYLAAYASSRLVLWAGRALLAHNRRLYPFHKWFLAEVGRCEELPAGFLARLDRMLAAPDGGLAAELVAVVHDAVGVHPSIAESAASFMRRTEWSWRAGGSAFDDA